MKKRSRTISKFLVGLIGLSMLCSSCFERTDGCLDSNASNFNVYADDDCCCTYPFINVGVFQRYGGADFEADSIYTNALGQQFQIISQAFFVSNFTLTYSDGTQSDILDTLMVELPLDSGNEVDLEDNFDLVTQTTAAFSPGPIATNGSISNVTFNIGLTEQANMLIPSQLADSHPLGSNNEAEYYIDGQGYVFYRWAIKVLNVNGVEDIVVAATGNNFLTSISLDWPAGLDNTFRQGSTTTIALQVNYDEWLEGIDFASDITTIGALINSNTALAFDIGQ